MHRINSRFLRFFLFSLLLPGLVVTAGPVFAQTDPGLAARQFGIGQPENISDLPPGQLRDKLQSLPPQVSARALQWLQDISFTGTDLEVLRVDDAGNVLFVDTLLPDAALASPEPSAVTTEAAPVTTLDDAFRLHSRPGAPNTVFIDFDGHVFTATAWGSGSFYGVPFDIDGDNATFNDTERGRIADIWHRIAEDLAPYNIDVTTEEPASFSRYTGRILITKDTDATGAAMPSKGAGGVAYVNVFGLSNYHTYYSPALVYYNNMAGGINAGTETYIAEAAAHEFGHNLGLSHDGTTTGTTYYAGHGSGLVSWAPIMGVGYYNNVTQWSKGEYAGANQTQDDLAIIQGKLGLKPDDHGNAIGSGTALDVAPDGSVVSSNPELDPHNVLPENKGVINSSADIDVFTFVAGAGPLSLTVTPAWDAFYRATTRRGANLDIQAELRNAAGVLLASSDPTSDTAATVNASIAAGTYHLLLTGVGNVTVPYSGYASLGQYFINGSMAPASADNTAPTPNPMSWAIPPSAIGESAIDMTATIASDETSTVQYNFQCVAGGSGCSNSGWQAANSHTASGLAAGTSYTFTVVARDLAGNQTSASPPASATTLVPPPPPPLVDIVADSDTAVAGSMSGSYTSTHANDGVVQSITEQLSGGKPQSRYSYLEHRWSFNASSGASVTVFANAWSSGSSDGDSFNFQYSLNGGGNWASLFTVSSSSDANEQSFVLPGAPGGSIQIRVIDSNHTSGAQQLNTVLVDHLHIQVSNPSSDPPAGNPSGLTATAVSSSRIDLQWTDGVSNETAYRIERSPDGNTGWAEVAALAANSESWGNSGLAASTTYYYRVSAYNLNGSSGYTTANATTTAVPATVLSLNATGSKVKNIAQINLSWSGSNLVDVYRNGTAVKLNVSGSSYIDNTGSKGAGTYTHQVCAAGATLDCSNTTTTVF